MKIFDDISAISDIENTSIALGFFDGLHIGHRKLLDLCIRDAETRGTNSAVFTFREHPKNVMAKKPLVSRLLLPSEKHALLESFGIDYLFEIPFEKDFQALTPEIFARDILAGTLSAKAVFCGFNFRFGRKAAGSPDSLIDFGEKYGFEVFVLDPVRSGTSESGAAAPAVSSTRIRNLIREGELENANALLGRAYALSGKVVAGKKLGHVLGFPTANFPFNPLMTTPPIGSYISLAHIEGFAKSLPAITNIGTNPTTDAHKGRDAALSVETHILEKDFSEELYGKKLKVELLRYLRPEQKFENLEALKEAIARDASAAIEYFR